MVSKQSLGNGLPCEYASPTHKTKARCFTELQTLALMGPNADETQATGRCSDPSNAATPCWMSLKY